MGAPRQRRLQLLILLAATLAGCSRVDVSRPVQLLPAAGLSPSVVSDLADAADTWNLEVGTQLVVVGPDKTPEAGQHVRVARSDLTCSFGAGLTRYAGDVDMQLCEPAAKFWVLLHELGHVVNIHEHADQRTSAMSLPGSGEITDQDRALFRESNPGFSEDKGCRVIRHLGTSTGQAVPIRSARGPLALLRDREGLSLHLLDEATAESRQLAARIGDAQVGNWAHFTLPSGLGVVWGVWGQDGAHLQLVDGQSLQPSAPVQLATGRLAINERIMGDARAVGQSLFIVIISGDGLELRRFDLPSGFYRDSPFRDTFPLTYGELHEAGGRLLLVRVPRTLTPDIAIIPLDADGAGQPAVTIPGLKARLCISDCPWPAIVDGKDDLIIVTGSAKGLRLTTVAASSLQVLRERDIPAPPGISSIEIATTAHGWLVTLSASRSEEAVPDVYVGLLDPADARLLKSWERLSPPQGKPDQLPRAVETRQGALVLWTQGEFGAEGQAVSRCLSLP